MNEYRIKKTGGFTEKINDGIYRKAMFIICAILIIGVLIWLFSSNATQTMKAESHFLTNQAHDMELPAIPSSSTNPSTTILDDQLNAQLVPVFKQPAFLDQLSTPYGFANDPIHDRLIWTSGGNGTFMSAKLDGSEITAIQSNFEDPYLIRIETPYGHKMIFYADGSLRLREIDNQMDTSSQTVLLSLQESELHGLAFDDLVNTVYIGDQFGQPSLAILIPAGDEPITATPLTLLNPK
jgi:hypothetical protein